jgi:hypothetical protein
MARSVKDELFNIYANKRTNKTEITDAYLPILDEQFAALHDKVQSGQYVVDAQREIKKSKDGTTDSLLIVIIKPSDSNRNAPIQSMAFHFDYRDKPGDELGDTYVNFRIDTADGNALIYFDKQTKLSGFLLEARKLGYDKINGEGYAVNQAKTAAIKNLKL